MAAMMSRENGLNYVPKLLAKMIGRKDWPKFMANRGHRVRAA
ncbi:hypothetical protein [Agrobacterium tumefaciens]|nr:hypothetical protein [Agrobacterium tumefaciens]